MLHLNMCKIVTSMKVTKFLVPGLCEAALLGEEKAYIPFIAARN